MVTIAGSKEGEPRTVRLSLQALGVIDFRMRLHEKTFDEVVEEVLLAMTDPRRAEEMAMEYLTNPVGWGPEQDNE